MRHRGRYHIINTSVTIRNYDEVEMKMTQSDGNLLGKLLGKLLGNFGKLIN